jgi:hydrogenase maturation factor
VRLQQVCFRTEKYVLYSSGSCIERLDEEEAPKAHVWNFSGVSQEFDRCEKSNP